QPEAEDDPVRLGRRADDEHAEEQRAVGGKRASRAQGLVSNVLWHGPPQLAQRGVICPISALQDARYCVGNMRTPRAALGAGLAIGLCASGCTDCKSMKANGSPFAGLLCGGEGVDAPQPNTPPLSLCQPREVMPVFFSLIDKNDPSLAGLRGAIADLGRPVCLEPKDRTCARDDPCAIGHCAGGLCPCQTS